MSEVLSIEPYLRALVELLGSDLHCKVGSPPRIRIDGTLRKLQAPVLTPSDTEAMLHEIARPDGMNQPCRIYAPVGSHEDLLAYLVRRLLENGANTSFVNRLADTSGCATSSRLSRGVNVQFTRVSAPNSVVSTSEKM